MRTKTNQTGLKMQGSASMLGRRGYIQRYVNRRVQTGFGVDGVWMDIQPDGDV